MNATRIRELNDQFRSTFDGGRVMLTTGVRLLPETDLRSLLRSVQGHTDFVAENDPNGEHDFGSIEVNNERFFWKIDYYDRSLEYGSPDPSDPTVTTRVLTVMRADEY